MMKSLPAALLAVLLAGTAAHAQTAATDDAAAKPANGMVTEGADSTAPGMPQAEADEMEEEKAAAATSPATVEHHDFGPSGIMARTNREQLAPLTLGSGKPVAEAPYMLKSGGYYRIDVTADGSAELALSGGDFFRAIWINEVVVNDIEIRPIGIHSIEFDEAGTATISFIAIQPGTFTLSIPGSTGETQRATFTIQ